MAQSKKCSANEERVLNIREFLNSRNFNFLLYHVKVCFGETIFPVLSESM